MLLAATFQCGLVSITANCRATQSVAEHLREAGWALLASRGGQTRHEADDCKGEPEALQGTEVKEQCGHYKLRTTVQVELGPECSSAANDKQKAK